MGSTKRSGHCGHAVMRSLHKQATPGDRIDRTGYAPFDRMTAQFERIDRMTA